MLHGTVKMSCCSLKPLFSALVCWVSAKPVGVCLTLEKVDSKFFKSVVWMTVFVFIVVVVVAAAEEVMVGSHHKTAALGLSYYRIAELLKNYLNMIMQNKLTRQ